MKKDKTKLEVYSMAIFKAVINVFDEENENFICKFSEVDLMQFMHAFANIAPAMLYNKTTGESGDLLEFNHIANRLVFYYLLEKREEEEK
ncbi:MAG: hypothetical protein LBS01_05035 [Prevotellaceae bacterium]|jgi:hypothetical protein|nr:hypothetical protein [Prevotellaceae bacterium]